MLTEKHFKIVSQTSAHFDDYLSNVHGIDEDDAFAVIAEREALRKEDVPSSVDWGRKRGPSPELRSKGGRRSIHRSSRQYGSESEDEVAPDDDTGGEEDDHETQIQEMEMKLQKMKNRRKSSTKEVSYGSREKTKERDGKVEKSRSRNTRLYESDEESDDD